MSESIEHTEPSIVTARLLLGSHTPSNGEWAVECGSGSVNLTSERRAVLPGGLFACGSIVVDRYGCRLRGIGERERYGLRGISMVGLVAMV